MFTKTKNLALLGMSAAMLVSLAACGGSSDSSGSSNKSGSSSNMSSQSASAPVGPGCAAYAKANPSGAGSVKGMSKAPVAKAAADNPMLTTLTKAVSGKLNPKVNLVDTLDGGKFTVFAPVDSAFKKVDSGTVNKLKSNKKLLSTVLTYHVIKGQLTPKQVIGSHKTVEGDTVKVSGTPKHLKVNGKSNVICGGVQTANATVYLVDSVLMPPMK